MNGEPRLLALKQALRVLSGSPLGGGHAGAPNLTSNKAQAAAHILEGLRIALKYLDEIIALIRGLHRMQNRHGSS